jgi:hypothetical protein
MYSCAMEFGGQLKKEGFWKERVGRRLQIQRHVIEVLKTFKFSN